LNLSGVTHKKWESARPQTRWVRSAKESTNLRRFLSLASCNVCTQTTSIRVLRLALRFGSVVWFLRNNRLNHVNAHRFLATSMVFPGPKVPHVRSQTSVWQWRGASAFLCRNSAPNPSCGPRGGHGCLPGFGRRANNAGPSKSASRSGLSIDMCTEGSFHPVPMGSHANL
jgi:hypothetical protein